MVFKMKLRNKKTGEIKAFDEVMREAYKWNNYNSLAELNAEWCDAPEEPKERHYYIEPRGQVIELEFGDDIDELKEELSGIGNYFSSREEAERAVEKLKAWKRLKDKGFRFYSWEYEFDRVDKPARTIILEATAVDATDDLELLFGGEE
jgi:hypothetical protein